MFTTIHVLTPLRLLPFSALDRASRIPNSLASLNVGGCTDGDNTAALARAAVCALALLPAAATTAATETAATHATTRTRRKRRTPRLDASLITSTPSC